MEKKKHTAFTILTMVNSCRVNPFQPGTKNLITSKKNTMRHGFGIKSIKKVDKMFILCYNSKSGGVGKNYYV